MVPAPDATASKTSSSRGQPVDDVLRDLGARVGDRRAVAGADERERAAPRGRPAAGAGWSMYSAHAAVRREDADAAEAGDHVAGDQDAAGRLDDAVVAGRVAGREDRLDREAVALDRLAPLDPVIDLDTVAEALDLLLLERVRPDRRAGAPLERRSIADVVRVAVRQDDLADALQVDAAVSPNAASRDIVRASCRRHRPASASASHPRHIPGERHSWAGRPSCRGWERRTSSMAGALGVDGQRLEARALRRCLRRAAAAPASAPCCGRP